MTSLRAAMLVAAVFVAAPPALAEPDVTHYRLELDIDPVATLITAAAEVTLVHDGSPQIALDFIGLEISAVTLDGAAATYSRADGVLSIDAPTVASGDVAVVTVDYAGTPEPYVTPWGILGIRFEADRVFAINVTEGARYWFPSHDAVYDKATVDFHLTVPAGWLAAAPGEQLGSAPFLFSATWPISPYLIAFYAAPFTLHEETHAGVDFKYWLHPTSWAKASETLEEAPQMLAWLVSRYGAYPYPQVGFAEIILGGAVESPSCIGIGSQVLGTNGAPMKSLIVHELAHTWFQGQVTIASWDDLWLSEGLTVYHETLWAEHKGGVEALRTAARALGQGYRSVADLLEGHFPITAPPQNWLFGFTVYRKGAHVFHTLRYILGDAGFEALLADYLATHTGGVASTADLEALIGAQPSASMPAAQFIHEWTAQAGFPIYAVEWAPRTDGSAVEVTLSQTQIPKFGGDPYQTPLELAFIGGGTQTRHTVSYEDWSSALQPGSASAVVTVTHAVDEVVVDPDAWVLHEAVITQLPAVAPPETSPEPSPEPPAEAPPESGPDVAADGGPETGPETGVQPVDTAGTLDSGCGASTPAPFAGTLLMALLLLLLLLLGGLLSRRRYGSIM